MTVTSKINKKIKAYLSKVGYDKANDIKVSRRRNLIATFKFKSKSFILKQNGTADTIYKDISIGNEILFLNNSSKNEEIKKMLFLPKVYHSSIDKDMLISRFYKGYKTLMVMKPNVNLYKEVGEQLGYLHNLDCDDFKKNHQEININNLLIQFDGFSPESISAGGPSIIQFIKLLQKYPDLLESVGDLYATYETNCVIHGDFKTDNILVYKKSEKYYLKIIDYEFTSIGDRHYDLGYILGSNLMNWIFKMNLKNDSLDFESQYFEELKSSFHSFISSYEQVTKVTLNYERIIKYAGIYLLKIFYNCSIQSRELGKNEIMFLQIARNYLVFSDKQTLIHFYDE
jgi:thiamine kinase-like enzyme